jgi:hypothetical protein
MKKIILVSVSLLINQACTTVKRYKSEHYGGQLNNDSALVNVSLYGAKIEDKKEDNPTGKNLWQLSNRGQNELLKIYNARYKSDTKFIDALSNKYLEETKNDPNLDFTEKNIKMVFSISKKRNYSNIKNRKTPFSPADRIEYLNFKLSVPKSAHLKFTKWNKYTTEYGSVDIADMTFNSSIAVDASAGISIPGKIDSVNAGITGTGTFSKTENQKVKYRFMQLHGTFADSSISIEEEGMREIDLDGNVIVDVSMKFNKARQSIMLFDNLINDTGQYNDPTKVKIKVMEAIVPDFDNIPNSITANLDFNYVYRGVKGRGSKTYYEWDDRVSYYGGNIRKPVNLFSKKDIFPDFYSIEKRGIKIKIKDTTDTNDMKELVFLNYENAKDFYNWLLKYPCKEKHKVNEEKNKEREKLTTTEKDENTPIIIGNYNLCYEGIVLTKKYLREQLEELLAISNFYH